jgi:hypothetical protein
MPSIPMLYGLPLDPGSQDTLLPNPRAGPADLDQKLDVSRCDGWPSTALAGKYDGLGLKAWVERYPFPEIV